MNLVELKNFLVVAEERNISKAAKELYISQQSLSAQVARLESELNVVLFTRGRMLTLTQEGRMFYNVAKEMVRLREQYTIDIQNQLAIPYMLRIGIQHTTARSILPNVLPNYYQKYPSTIIKFEEADTDDTKRSVDYDVLDFAIGPVPVVSEHYNIVHLCKKTQLLIVPRKFMGLLEAEKGARISDSSADPVDLKMFQQFPFIKMKETDWAGDILRSYCVANQINLDYIVELSNIDVAFQVACAGIGCLIYSRFFYTSMPYAIRKEYEKQICVFPLPDPPSLGTLCAYYRKRKSMSVPAKGFIEIVQDYFDHEKELDIP